MTHFRKNAEGKYVVNGKVYERLIGTRAQVWHETAYKTTGGLTKADLIQNKAGRIVSKSKFNSAKREKRLLKYGYATKKGKFGFVKMNGKSKKMRGKRSRRMKGGSLNPANYPGERVGTSGVNLQFVAGNATS
jgi:ribosomal protein S30